MRFLLILIAVTAVAQPAAITSGDHIQEQTHRIQALARIGLNYFALEILVWYRNPQEAAKH